MSWRDDVTTWMRAFASCVRERDFARGRELFADDVSSFGTAARRARGLAVLERDQWRRVWPETEGFEFDVDTMDVVASDDRSLVAVLAGWQSRGVAEDGTTFPRRGRATVLLARRPGAPHGYEAVHSHFSLVPDPA